MNSIKKRLLQAGPALLLSSLAMSQSPTFTGLGYVSSDHPWSEVTGLSDDGTVVVGNTQGPEPSAELQTFRWTAAVGMQPIGNPPLTQGTPFGSSSCISGNGWVIVGSSKFDGIGPAGFEWNPANGFAPLAAAKLGGAATTKATNGNGEVSVGQTRFGVQVGMLTHKQATVWFPDGSPEGHPIGLYPGGVTSSALGVSRDGTVVVGEATLDKEEGVTAFRWDELDGFVSLGDLPGGYHFSRANAASQSGAEIVGYGTVSFLAGFVVDHRACVWDQHGVTELPNLAGNSRSEALDISPDGRFIVGWATVAADSVPVIWDEVNGIRDIREILIQTGFDMSSWKLLRASAVSADGKTIVGSGTRVPSSNREGWICTLP